MPGGSLLVERVAGFVAEHGVLEPGEPVVALVSGGADSLCLWGVLRELGHPVEALHVEHGLRGEAGLADAALCAGLGATVVPRRPRGRGRTWRRAPARPATRPPASTPRAGSSRPATP